MERATVMKTFHGNLAPKSPTLRDRDAPFSSHLRPDKPITCQSHHTIRSGRCRALDDSTTELSIFDAHKYFNEATNNDIQKVTISSNSKVSPLVNMDNMERVPERGDITETSRYSSASSSADGYANIRNYRARSFHAATPTASSEASWNSQAGLLSRPPGAIPVSMRNPPDPTDLNKKLRASLSKPIWLLRRKCPCSGKKSVEVKEKTPESKTQTPQPPPPPPPPRDQSLNLKRQGLDLDSNPKTTNMETAPKKPETIKIPITPNNWVVDQRHHEDQAATFVSTKPQRFQPQRVLTSVRVPFTDGFTFPVLNPHSSSSTSTKLQVQNGVVANEEEEEEEPPRDSLEVFRPPDIIEPTSVSPKPLIDSQNFPFPPSPTSRVVTVDADDAASDTSSDLFEIESFSTTTQSTSTHPTIYRRRDSLDEASNTAANRSNGFFLGGGRRSTDGSMTPTITECYEPSEASIEWSVTTAEGYDRASVANFSEAGADVESSTSAAAAEKWKRKGSSSSGNGLLMSCRCEKAVSVGPQPVKCGGAEGPRGGATGGLTSRHVSGRPVSGSASVNKPPLGRSHNTTARVSLAFAT